MNLQKEGELTILVLYHFLHIRTSIFDACTIFISVRS